MRLLAEIASVIPIDAIKSIDELTCRLDTKDIADPTCLATEIKRRLHDNVGAYITCSIGFAANRHLAKIACKMDKPDGITIWHPCDMPAPMLSLPFDDIPGIGNSMEKRLHRAGIYDIKSLLATEPKQMRKLMGQCYGRTALVCTTWLRGKSREIQARYVRAWPCPTPKLTKFH